MNKVRTGSTYVYNPVGMDIYDPKTNLKAGDLVVVVKKLGCPPPNTMGHCHVEKILHNGNGQRVFAGLVLTNSLTKYKGS